MTHQNEYLVIQAKPADEAEARDLRAQRDELYPNYYQIPEGQEDTRWVGDLAEILYARYLSEQGVPHLWHKDDPLGSGDFQIGWHCVDIKGVKRQRCPPPDYYAGVDEFNYRKQSPIDNYLFASYEYFMGKMWYVGGMTVEAFKQSAVFFPAGSIVHDNFTAPENLYNVTIYELISPQLWLEEVKGYRL